MIKLLHGDCLTHMAALPAGSVDMILADLPYGSTQNHWDRIIPFEPLWKQYRRIAKPNAAIVLTATQPFASALIQSNPTEFKYDLVWRKNKPTGFLNAKKQPLRSHESILVFYRRPPTYNPQKTTGHAPGHVARQASRSSNYGEMTARPEYGGSTERYPTSVLDIPVINNDSPDKTHPTQKPVALNEWLIRTYTNEGNTVLDNCMGSGTAGVAAKNLGRRFIGIELLAEYFETAKRRLGALVTPELSEMLA